jgi:iron(III) transport system substrate-binding protein
VAARVVQESQADVGTASVVTSDAASLAELGSRDLLEQEDWAAAGIPAELVASDDLVASAASVFLMLYNSDLVSESEAPKEWEDLLDPRWTGKLGTWESPYAFAELVPAWGGDRVTQYVQDFNAQQPTKYQSTFPLAQAVGAGEIEAGVGIYHSTLPAIAEGAPIELVVPDPVPVTMLYSAVPTAAACPATGALFTGWLATESGATSYEGATGRGNPLLPGTETAQLVEGRSISDFAPEDSAELADWLTRLSR